MVRMQVVLDPEMQRRARKKAAELGVSVAEYIRRLVDRDLGTQGQAIGPDAIFDLGRSREADVAKEKDAMVGAAVAGRRIARGGRR